jgi:excisionase family DNA binding protein
VAKRDPSVVRRQIQQRGRAPLGAPKTAANAAVPKSVNLDGIVRGDAGERLTVADRRRAVRREFDLDAERSAAVAAALAQIDVAAARFEQLAPALSVPLTPEVVQQLAETLYGMLAERFAQAQQAPQKKYLTVQEAADYIGVKRQRIYDLTSAGRLTRLKDGTRTLLDREEIDAYLRGEKRR